LIVTRRKAAAREEGSLDFARVHQTLGITPAVEAGVADHVWTLREIAGLLDRPRTL
jgi:hypothetical protein